MGKNCPTSPSANYLTLRHAMWQKIAIDSSWMFIILWPNPPTGTSVCQWSKELITSTTITVWSDLRSVVFWVTFSLFEGNKLTSQLVPLPTYVLNLPGRVSNATHELVFLAAQLPPVGFKSYYVQRTATQRRLKKPTTTRRNRFADTIISNEVRYQL